MLHDLLKFHFKLMILFQIPFICTFYDIVLPNKYLSIYLSERVVKGDLTGRFLGITV